MARRYLIVGATLLIAVAFFAVSYAKLAGIKKGMVNNLWQMQGLLAYL